MRSEALPGHRYELPAFQISGPQDNEATGHHQHDHGNGGRHGVVLRILLEQVEYTGSEHEPALGHPKDTGHPELFGGCHEDQQCRRHDPRRHQGKGDAAHCLKLAGT